MTFSSAHPAHVKMITTVMQVTCATTNASSRAWPPCVVAHHHTLLLPHPWDYWSGQPQPNPALTWFTPVFVSGVLPQGARPANASGWTPSRSKPFFKLKGDTVRQGTLLISTNSAGSHHLTHFQSPLPHQDHHTRAGALGLHLHSWRIKSSLPHELLATNTNSL